MRAERSLRTNCNRFPGARVNLRSNSVIDLCFVILPDTLVMDWAGPAEAFRIANQKLVATGMSARFNLRFVGPMAESATSVGLRVSGLEPLPTRFEEATWLIFLGMPGNTVNIRKPAVLQTLKWLRGLAPLPGAVKLVSVCAGALLLAHAGLLKGVRATTHHTHLEELRQAEPLCEVIANRVFVMDESVWTSAGVTTGIDLAIHLIAQHTTEAVAAYVAQTMVLAHRRGANDPELSPFLQARNHMHPALHRVQDAVSEDPLALWDVALMAEIGCVTPRHLARLFSVHTDTSPLHYLRGIRLAVAQRALAQGVSVTQASEQAGFNSDLQLRRAWQAAKLPGTPSQAA
jgi:transcriptional regulator GlxA family with amidase domain